MHLMQIRTDDKHMAGADLAESYAEQYRYMFECAEQMERALGISSNAAGGGAIAPKFFLVSDSVVVRQQAQVRAGVGVRGAGCVHDTNAGGRAFTCQEELIVWGACWDG